MASRDKSPQLGLSDDKVELLVRELTKKRGTLKGRLTKFGTYVNNFDINNATSQNKIDLKLRIEGARNIYREFDSIQSRIEECVSGESGLDDQLTQRELFEDCYYSTLSQAELLLSGSGSSGGEVTCSKICSSSQLRAIKLPTITLPSFNGAYEHWLEFRDTFQSLVHDSEEITSIQKFHYLKSSLKGSAELVIDALEFTSNNYSVAWELLLNRYNNNRLLVHNHIKTIFNIQALSKESPVSIRNLSDTILKNLRALKVLGEPVDSWDTLIIFIIVSKLDKTTEREWEQFKGTLSTNNNDSKLKLKVNDLISFLKNRADMLETLQGSHNSHYNKDSKNNTNVKSSSHKCNVSTTSHDRRSAPKKCVMCSGDHQLYACSKFIDSDLESKLKFIREKGLCENCLKYSNHTADLCKFGGCRRCSKKHNSIIHPPDNTKPIDSGNSSLTLHSSLNDRQLTSGASAGHLSIPSTPFNPADSASHTNNTQLHDNRTHSLGPVLLSTALIEVQTRYNNYLLANALLDNGSERSFVSEPFCKKIGIDLLQSTHEIRGVGNSVTQCTKSCHIEIKSRISTYTAKLHCFVLPQISSTLPAVHYERAKFRIPNNVQLADPHFLDSRKIDILIGAEKFWDLLNEGNIRLPNGPCLQNTHLGWIISGAILFNTRKDSVIQCNFSQSIDTQLRQFWELEEVPRNQDTRTDDERVCEDLFTRTTTRNDEGRFIVSIPLKSSPDVLGESYSQAERRFLALEKRLQRAPAFKKLYSDFLREYERLGHMTRVSTYKTPHYFMPHHGVFREQSSTTKLRVVYDAGAVTSTGISFNDLQLVGPPIQGDLIAILLRFRQHRYVACADIEKMYRQCLVIEDQRDLQLILWRDEPTQPLCIYRLNTVTYGTASAPFLSVRCLKQLAVESKNAKVSRIINEDFYVDDLITGSSDKINLINLCEETTSTLQAGCFPLRKWIFNFTPQSVTASSCAHKNILGENTNHKTLGMGWLNGSDEFCFNTEFNCDGNVTSITKRTILSHASQIFDPLGILSPFIITAKQLLQQLWLLKLEWDDAVPADIERQWNRFLASLSILNTIRVPRYVMDTNSICTEMHVFSDASQTAYGACVYIRTLKASNHTVKVRLLCSKGKVAPLKPISIPRLELLGALIGARLFNKILNSLHFNFDRVMFWTDSTIVLGWLRMPPRLLKTFVQNRTIEIHDLTKDLPWRHVSGKENPADLVSRGVVNIEELSLSKLWWEGPGFLRDSEFNCETASPYNTHDIQLNELPETKGSDVNALVTRDKSSFEDGSIIDFKRFSQFNRLRRSTAYVLRFLHNSRNKLKKITGVLSIDELGEAEKLLTRLSQLESFPVEYKSIANNRALKKKHNLSKLNLFLDNDKLVRVGGRLDYSSEFDYNKKHPILLSGKHYFTFLIFRYEHKTLLHAAPQALLFHIRETWWPLSGRNLARTIVHECVVCKRLRGRTLTPLMGNLPSERITPTFPFFRCGVDYAGPVLILNRKGRGAKTTKAYICIFICLVTRAVHLELVSDLTAKAYCLTLNRFMSRRSKPAEIWSDNGRNFVGLKNEFAQFLERCSSEIIEYANQQKINFKFIVPYAAHFGGLWEAGVRSFKHHLRRVVGNANLTYEEFSTVLAQVEAVLNSRPLSPMSSNPNDLLPLSPAHFLVGRTLTAPACENLTNTAMHKLDRYERVEQIRQHFWRRWSKEYISELQTRTKWKDITQDLKPNTMVIIKEDHFPPLRWHLGRVVRNIPGKDGIARVAEIQTSSGLVRRAYTKICPLVDPEETNLEANSSKAGGMFTQKRNVTMTSH